MPATDRIPFVIIGENVHATRSFARQGRNIVTTDGVEVVAFRDAQGVERTCPIAPAIAESSDFAKNKVKHIRNALLLGLAGEGLVPASLSGDVTREAAAAGRD